MRRLIVSPLPALGALTEASPEASHHVLHVLRARPGERFFLTDGRGGAGIGELEGVSPSGRATLRVQQVLEPVLGPRRVLVLGMPKAALLEESVTLAAEGGATELLVVRARYSPPGDLRAERLDRVLRAAVTQCGRADLPPIRGPFSLGAALDHPSLASAETRWIASPGGPPATAGQEDAAVAIGPEGGWAPEEQDALRQAGFQSAGLGPHVLRTPSAVSAALARLWPG
jgi:16S rRNA (uracil1498-N3)-methyltransferase